MAEASREFATPGIVRGALGEGLVNTIGDDLTNLMFLAGFLKNPLAMGGILGGIYGLRKLFGGGKGGPEEAPVRSLDEAPQLRTGMIDVPAEPVETGTPSPSTTRATVTARASTPHAGAGASDKVITAFESPPPQLRTDRMIDIPPRMEVGDTLDVLAPMLPSMGGALPMAAVGAAAPTAARMPPSRESSLFNLATGGGGANSIDEWFKNQSGPGLVSLLGMALRR